MKRITEACICQTVVFSPKEKMDRSKTIKEMLKEANDYKEFFDRIKTPYKILRETIRDDGSVVVEIRKKYGRYYTGKYIE